MTPADRRRLVKELEHPPASAAKDPSKFRYRFTQGGVEWGVTEEGHYRVLRCGDLAPNARVRLRIRGLTHRYGRVLALIPGYGYPLPVVAVVELDRIRSKDPQITDLAPIIRHYRPEDLEVVT